MTQVRDPGVEDIARRVPGLRPRPQDWLVPATVTGSLVPFAVIFARGVTGRLGANPIATALNQLGLLALLFLVTGLACTPLKLVFGWTWPIRIRRTLGLFAFAAASLHFVVYALLDQLLMVRAIAVDIAKRPFILVGFVALVLLVPLALTSSKKMLMRLGFRRWKLLHRLTYLVVVLGLVHFFLRVKADVSEPAGYALVVLVLFSVRLGFAWAARRNRSALGVH